MGVIIGERKVVVEEGNLNPVASCSTTAALVSPQAGNSYRNAMTLLLTWNRTEISFSPPFSKVTLIVFDWLYIYDYFIFLCVYSLSTSPVVDSTNLISNLKSPSLVTNHSGEFSIIVFPL